MSGFWIIGFRAAGKTTWGKELAERLSLRFLDVDEEWEARAGESILSFVAREGVEAFRRKEAELLAEIAQRLGQGQALVVATGGGFVDWEPSRQILQASSAPKLYLNLPAATLWERLERAPERQKIGDLTSIERVQTLLAERGPFYEKIATLNWKDQDINGCLAALKLVLRRPRP